jgi:hypothetical protein
VSEHWVRDLGGNKALVADADLDHWRMHGWTEAGEPTDRESVWWHKDDVDQPGLIAWGARAYWQGIGWMPGAPPAPVNPTRDPVLTDVPEKPPAGQAPADKITSAAKPAAKNKE